MRVVVGEAAGSNRTSIRSILEHAGFDIIGYAASDVGLEAVLAGVRPEAIVVDAHIGVRSVQAARQLAPAAKIIVVWPPAVSAAIADDRVDPSRVNEELASVVRRAAGTPIDVSPMTFQHFVPAPPRLVLSPRWERTRRPRRHVAALTLAATLALGAAAFAIGAPHWSDRADTSDRRTGGHHRSSLSTSSTDGRHDVGRPDGGGSTQTPSGCVDGRGNGQGTPPEKGGAHNNGRHLGNGSQGTCHPTGRPSGAGRPDNPGGNGHGGGQGQGQGKPSPHPKPSHPPHPDHPGPSHS